MTENRKMKMLQSGQVTVFAALLFMVVFSLLAAQYQSALYYMQRASAERAARMSVESFLAGYNRPLRDYYQILAVDGGRGHENFYSEGLKGALEAVFRENLKNIPGAGGETEISMEEPIYTLFIDGDWDFFLREITLNRKAELTEDFFQLLMEQWNRESDQASGELRQKKEEQRQAEAAESIDGENKETEGKTETEIQITDPRDFIMEIWNQGILMAACPEDYRLSEKECPMTDISFPEAGRRINETIDFKDDGNILSILESWSCGWNYGEELRETAADAAVCMYIQEVFSDASNATPEIEHERVLDYEIEYILAGNESDKENLKAVLWKLIAFRCVMNMAHLSADSEKQVQVYDTALLVSAAILIPQFTEITAFLLKMAWAFAEALADCRTLLKGGKVPVIKDNTSWYLSWNQMLHMERGILDGNPGNTGMDYGEYLRLFLFLMNREVKYRRMTNLMEKNIRLVPEYEKFRMDYCIYGIQAVFHCTLGTGVDCRTQMALSY